MTATHVFGYGSLVNVRTHAFGAVEGARLSGFRRVWQPSPLRPVAYLTVVVEDRAEVLGATAPVPAPHWPELDERERAYRRRALRQTAIGGRRGVHVYAADGVAPPKRDQPILLSYLDVVIQGFLDVHGEAGAEEFFTSTRGWDTPVLNDRAAPRYMRHQPTDLRERALTDAGLQAVGALVITP